jgi:hypothetical protein
LRAAAELVRYRDAAQRLVRSLWAQRPLPANGLLRIGSLSSERIFELMAWRCAATASRAVAHFRGTTASLNLNEYFICRSVSISECIIDSLVLF